MSLQMMVPTYEHQRISVGDQRSYKMKVKLHIVFAPHRDTFVICLLRISFFIWNVNEIN